MKRLLLALTLLLSWNASAAEWLTDLPTAMKKAREEGKIVLLDFTGSDWCIWCKKLKMEVFDKQEFKKYADANLVLVEVDFPQDKKLPAAQTQANDALAKRFRVKGYPTVVVLDQDENSLGELGYVAGGPKSFIAELEQIPQPKRGEPGTAANRPPSPAPPAPVLAGPPVKIEYKQVALKAITGPKGKRLALINNQPFAEGETAMIKLGDAKLKVLCKEIRDDSVLVEIDGKPAVELALGKPSDPGKEAAK